MRLNSFKVIRYVVLSAYIKIGAFFKGNKFEIRKKEEIKIIAYLNRAMISVNKYYNYNNKKVFYNSTINELLK
jgi:hypothetical protein